MTVCSASLLVASASPDVERHVYENHGHKPRNHLAQVKALWMWSPQWSSTPGPALGAISSAATRGSQHLLGVVGTRRGTAHPVPGTQRVLNNWGPISWIGPSYWGTGSHPQAAWGSAGWGTMTARKGYLSKGSPTEASSLKISTVKTKAKTAKAGQMSKRR